MLFYSLIFIIPFLSFRSKYTFSQSYSCSLSQNPWLCSVLFPNISQRSIDSFICSVFTLFLNVYFDIISYGSLGTYWTIDYFSILFEICVEIPYPAGVIELYEMLPATRHCLKFRCWPSCWLPQLDLLVFVLYTIQQNRISITRWELNLTYTQKCRYIWNETNKEKRLRHWHMLYA